MCRDCLQSSLKISLDWRSFSVDVNKEDPSIMIRNDISSHYQCLVPRIKTLNCGFYNMHTDFFFFFISCSTGCEKYVNLKPSNLKYSGLEKK